MIKNLIPDDPHHFEALLARDRVDNHISMNTNKVLAIKNRVFILSGRVDDFDGKVLVAILDDFAKSVFNGGVVGIDKVAVDVLDCQ